VQIVVSTGSWLSSRTRHNNNNNIGKKREKKKREEEEETMATLGAARRSRSQGPRRAKPLVFSSHMLG
jgi:hypothetical protein